MWLNWQAATSRWTRISQEERSKGVENLASVVFLSSVATLVRKRSLRGR